MSSRNVVVMSLVLALCCTSGCVADEAERSGSRDVLSERVTQLELNVLGLDGTVSEIEERLDSIDVTGRPLTPDLRKARLRANETFAASTLRTIRSSAAHFQSIAGIDLDNDGIGEFGVLQELSGAVALRTASDGSSVGGSVLDPIVLSAAFRSVNANAEVARSGYLFKVFLPGKGGFAVGEGVGAVLAAGSTIDTDLAERTWCAYAWPIAYGFTGRRTFFVNQEGIITAKDDAGTSGTGDITARNAGDAFLPGLFGPPLA